MALAAAALLALPSGGVLAQATVPEGLARVEEARTRRCVPLIARAHEVEAEMAPLFARAERIQMLNAAVALEDSARIAQGLDDSDPIEQAVRAWFVEDQALAARFVETSDSALVVQRAEAKERIRARLQEALDPLRQQTEAILAERGDAITAAGGCSDVFLVRGAAVAACDAGATGPVCEDVRSGEPLGRFAFVDDAAALWEVEQIHPWSDAMALYRAPDGALAGSRTVAMTRRGNLILAVGLEPMLRERATLPAEELAEMEANLDSLGFAFESERFTMTPVLTIQLNADAPLGGETDYVLHFGDLSDPLNDIIWTARVGAGPVNVVAPMAGWVLNALATGDPVTFTALKRDPATGEADVVYALGLAPVGQPAAVGGLLTYMANGDMAADLARLVAEAQPAPAAPPPPPPPGR